MPELLRPVVERLGAWATLAVVADADHAFHVPARPGRRDEDVLAELANVMARWMPAVATK